MRVVILVPRASDYGGPRDRIWSWVQGWLRTHHPDWPIYEGTDGSEVFSMSAARNNAARAAGDWDVAVIVDADTIAHPSSVREAVEMAHTTRKMWLAGDMRMRMDYVSSERILDGGLWFPRPEGKRHPKGNVIDEMCYGEPSSGVFAIGRPLWDATGGYVESLQGWGWEDLIFITQCYCVDGAIDWVRNSMLLHFYHDRTPEDANTVKNKRIWEGFHRASTRSHELAKNQLRALGHQW